MEENSFRKRRAELLRSAFELEIEKGWRPEIKALKEIQRPSVIQLSQTTLDRKLAMDFSDAYKADLKQIRLPRSKQTLHTNSRGSRSFK